VKKDEGELTLATTLWSALTCLRFSRSRPVATMIRLSAEKDFGVKPPKNKAVTGPRTPKGFALFLLAVSLNFACAASPERHTLPPEVESTIGTLSEEIAAERYDKIYNEASELFRQDVTLEQSVASFKTLRTKLGAVESHVLQSATEQQNSGGPLVGRAYIVSYRTKFQNAEGMETFTLVERNGRWLLARYFVNSTALK
jgi:hypothetical protein